MQRALLLPVLEPVLGSVASVSRPATGTAVMNGPLSERSSVVAGDDVQRFAIHAADSKLEVRGGDLITGNHVMRFDRWRGSFFLDARSPPDRPSGRLLLDIELSSLQTDPVVDDSLRNHLMEVSRYPRARFSGTIRPRSDQTEGYVFQGRLSLHGVERVIRFHVDLRRAKDGYLVDTEFDMSRDAFGMHRKDTIDLVIYDDFRVLFALVAHAEQVSAETVP